MIVGGCFHPSEKYNRQIGSFSKIGLKIQNIWNRHLAVNPACLLLGSLYWLKKGPSIFPMIVCGFKPFEQ